jgi:Family of unknown function (DUF6572)
MTVLDRDIVDFVARKPDSNVVKLGIADHLEWDRELEWHCERIRDKVETYLTFIETGQIGQLTKVTLPERPEIHIVLFTQFKPAAEAGDFLSRLKAAAGAYGVDFEVEEHAFEPT